MTQGATKWPDFWLNSELFFKTHFENRMASAKGDLLRISSLIRSNGGLPVNLVWRELVATITFEAFYGSEIGWSDHNDRWEKVQLLRGIARQEQSQVC